MFVTTEIAGPHNLTFQIGVNCFNKVQRDNEDLMTWVPPNSTCVHGDGSPHGPAQAPQSTLLRHF